MVEPAPSFGFDTARRALRDEARVRSKDACDRGATRCETAREQKSRRRAKLLNMQCKEPVPSFGFSARRGRRAES